MDICLLLDHFLWGLKKKMCDNTQKAGGPRTQEMETRWSSARAELLTPTVGTLHTSHQHTVKSLVQESGLQFITQGTTTM
jgi:hypothetical protein